MNKEAMRATYTYADVENARINGAAERGDKFREAIIDILDDSDTTTDTKFKLLRDL